MRELKIALVQPNNNWKVNDVLSIPLGLAWLSASLKHANYNVDCYDLLLSPEKEKILIIKKYDVIGIQLHTIDSVDDAFLLIEKIKKIQPKVSIILGGLAATFMWNNLLDNKNIDYIVVGEGELTTVELLDYLSKRKICNIQSVNGLALLIEGKKVLTGNRPPMLTLDDLPFPDRDAFDTNKYPQWSIITSRGCPYNCIFCTVPKFWNGSYRFRSATNIYQELCELERSFGMKDFFILDETFSLNKNRTSQLMEMMIKGKHDFHWACLTRVDCIDIELMRLFKEAGCVEISYGVESINQKTLDLLKKGITSLQIKSAIQLAKKNDIRVRCSFIFGLPGETYDDVLNTINFMLNTDIDEIQIYPLIPYPGTLIYDNLKKYSITFINNDFNSWNKNAEKPMIETKYLSNDNVVKLVHFCVKKLKEKGYIWIPGDKKPGKYSLDKSVMTEFSPIQALERRY